MRLKVEQERILIQPEDGGDWTAQDAVYLREVLNLRKTGDTADCVLTTHCSDCEHPTIEIKRR